MVRTFVLSTLVLGACAPETFPSVEPERDALSEILDAYGSGGATEDQLLTLLAVAIQQPDRLEARGVDVASVRTDLLDRLKHRVDAPYPHSFAPSDDGWRPRLSFIEAMRAYRIGDTAVGDSLFALAIDHAESDRQRAEYFYIRGHEGDLDRALDILPSHGPSLYQRAVNIGGAIGRPTSLTGRFAYWCVADEFRNVAARTTDSRIASLARTAAARYERSGPTREQYELGGWRAGDTVEASLGEYGTCTTTVR